MATNHTEHWDLNQWEAEDGVCRADFNDDNQKIETALTRLGSCFSIGATGYDSSADVTVELGRKPLMVIVFCEYGFKSAYSTTFPGHAIAMQGMDGYRDEGSSATHEKLALKLTDTGFTLYKNGLSTKFGPYYYLALFDPMA